ncbi:unnamed protein product [Citrullus colocynthis]|uniref:Uncharacterized protein n=1 Tax=Citrullus colocynthis TaxID=252529 RepID=A0ABP0Z3V8_9ROSI
MVLQCSNGGLSGIENDLAVPKEEDKVIGGANNLTQKWLSFLMGSSHFPFFFFSAPR